MSVLDAAKRQKRMEQYVLRLSERSKDKSFALAERDGAQKCLQKLLTIEKKQILADKKRLLEECYDVEKEPVEMILRDGAKIYEESTEAKQLGMMMQAYCHNPGKCRVSVTQSRDCVSVVSGSGDAAEVQTPAMKSVKFEYEMKIADDFELELAAQTQSSQSPLSPS